MRITIVGNFGLGYKGTMSARAVPIARELAALGHQVTLLAPAESGSPASTETGLGFRLIQVTTAGNAINSGRGLRAGIGHLIRGLQLTWLAIRSQPDILYAFKPKGYAGLSLLVFWLLRVVRLSRAKIVLDIDDWVGVGGWVDLEPGSWWENRFVTWHERWCLAHADLITAASHELVTLAGRDARSILFLPNAASRASPGWIPGDRDAGRARLGVRDAPIILAYTRFLEFAPSRLLDIFAAILKKVPTARFVVAGKGLHGEEVAFAAEAARRGLTDRVINLGWTNPAELPAIFAASDVAVYPLDDNLLNRAKCPMKLVDLLLAGTAVVADQVGQASEYIIDGQTGRLVPTGNVEAMTDAVVALLEDECLRKTMGDAARRDILNRWNWAREAIRIDGAFRGL